MVQFFIFWVRYKVKMVRNFTVAIIGKVIMVDNFVRVVGNFVRVIGN